MPEAIHDQRLELTDELIEEAHSVNGAYDFLAEHNVQDMAGRTIEAHGQRMTVAEGIAGCPPFARAVRGAAEDLQDMGVEDKVKIEGFVRRTLERQVTQAPTTVVTEAEKK